MNFMLKLALREWFLSSDWNGKVSTVQKGWSDQRTNEGLGEDE